MGERAAPFGTAEPLRGCAIPPAFDCARSPPGNVVALARDPAGRLSSRPDCTEHPCPSGALGERIALGAAQLQMLPQKPVRKLRRPTAYGRWRSWVTAALRVEQSIGSRSSRTRVGGRLFCCGRGCGGASSSNRLRGKAFGRAWSGLVERLMRSSAASRASGRRRRVVGRARGHDGWWPVDRAPGQVRLGAARQGWPLLRGELSSMGAWPAAANQSGVVMPAPGPLHYQNRNGQARHKAWGLIQRGGTDKMQSARNPCPLSAAITFHTNGSPSVDPTCRPCPPLDHVEGQRLPERA